MTLLFGYGYDIGSRDLGHGYQVFREGHFSKFIGFGFSPAAIGSREFELILE